MSGASSIQWCDATWNPTRGCSVISEGCHNCYAMRQAHRFNKPGGAFEGYTKATKAGPQWTGKVRIAEKALDWPLRYKGHPDAIAEGRPTRIFVNSMSDLFHESLSFPEIARVFAVMQLSQRHIFQILTKRSARMRAFYEWLFTEEGKSAWLDAVIGAPDGGVESWSTRWPFRNIWLGVSAENQERADERIPDLLATPAAVRFVSAEPLIGDLSLHRGLMGGVCGMCSSGGGTTYVLRGQPCPACGSQPYHMDKLDWVIAGGESGPKARPCDVSWIRSIKDQCQAAGVPVFVKQLGSKPKEIGVVKTFGRDLNFAYTFHDRKGGDPSEWPKDLRVREMPR